MLTVVKNRVTTVTVKKMVQYHINRLKDKSPDVRLKSISELSLLGDADALEALQDVFQTDDNSEVRKAAQEAGRAIFLKQKQQQS
jgi:HEAT repeat protein